MAFGALSLIVGINKGVGMVHKDTTTTRQTSYGENGEMVSITEEIHHVVDSAAAAPTKISDSISVDNKAH